MIGGADWRPTAPLEHLRRRARLLAELRAFFAARDVLEVDLPLLGHAPVTDPQIEALTVPVGTETCYLQTSPEYAMKRLLAAGSGAIYQLAKVFRAGEKGRRHNPEFTLLEWYRPGYTLERLIAEAAALVNVILGARPLRVVPYRQLFLQHLQLDIHTVTDRDLEACARGRIELNFDAASRDSWLNLLFASEIEPRLGRGEITAATEFPASQAALAQLTDDSAGQPVAERFELFVDGMELANGYHELTDSAEQARRFEADLTARRALGQPEPPQDRRLLAALAAGLPDCCGVAMGVDRLLMLALGAETIDQVLAFPFERA